MPAPGMIDNQSAHDARRIPHESRAVGKRRAVSRGHIQVRLVQERCHAEANRNAVSGELALGQPVQLGVECTEERFCSGGVTSFGSANERRNRGFHSSLPTPSRESQRTIVSRNLQEQSRRCTHSCTTRSCATHARFRLRRPGREWRLALFATGAALREPGDINVEPGTVVAKHDGLPVIAKECQLRVDRRARACRFRPIRAIKCSVEICREHP